MFPGQARVTAVLRAKATKFMPDTCDVIGRDGVNVYTAAPCRVDRNKEGNADPAQELNMAINSYALVMPYNYILQKDYRVVHGGHKYELTAIFNDTTPLIQVEATMERVSA